VDSAKAVDFLVRQVLEQASLEGVSVSELERQLMYSQDRAKRADKLTARDLIVFDGKISTLLRQAHRRLRKGSPEALETWNRAVFALEDGNHLFQLWQALPESRQPPHFGLVKRVAVSLLITVAAAIAIVLWFFLKQPK
jgi:hypothetical protein